MWIGTPTESYVHSMSRCEVDYMHNLLRLYVKWIGVNKTTHAQLPMYISMPSHRAMLKETIHAHLLCAYVHM